MKVNYTLDRTSVRMYNNTRGFWQHEVRKSRIICVHREVRREQEGINRKNTLKMQKKPTFLR